MTTRLTARWEFLDEPLTHCPACQRRLTPYLPKCLSCGEQIPSAVNDVRFDARETEKAEGAVRIAHLSDLHIGQHVPPTKLMPMATFRIWLERLQHYSVDLLIVSGDLVERPGDTYGMTRARALLDDSGLEWMVVPGNHDIRRPGHHDAFFDVFGTYPRLEIRHGIAFVMFDSMAGLPLEERQATERMYGDYVCYTEGRVGAQQYAAMSEALERCDVTRRALVLHHHVMRQHADLMPLTPRQAGITEDLFGTMKALMDADELFIWAKNHGIRTIYHGHKHLFQQPGMRDGNILVLNAGSSTLREGSQRGRLIDYLPGRRVVSNMELLL